MGPTHKQSIKNCVYTQVYNILHTDSIHYSCNNNNNHHQNIPLLKLAKLILKLDLSVNYHLTDNKFSMEINNILS